MTAESQNRNEIPASLRQAVAAAQDRKALDLRVLHLEEVADFTDFFVICSGASDRQVKAIAEGIVRRMRDFKVRPHHLEGLRHGRWVLIDFGAFVVHVFDQETRSYYGLEGLWADAPDVTGELGP